MAAYCSGVNAYIDSGQLPIEFSLLAYQPECWFFFDTVVWGAVLTRGLSVNWETELFLSLLLHAVGPEKAADMTSLYRDAYKTILPATRVGEPLAREILRHYQQAALLMPLGSVAVKHFHDHDDKLYEFNDHWLEADSALEEIRVRGRGPVIETIRYTRHGPILSDLVATQGGDLSLCCYSHSPVNQIRCFLDRCNHAHTKRCGQESLGSSDTANLRCWHCPWNVPVY